MTRTLAGEVASVAYKIYAKLEQLDERQAGRALDLIDRFFTNPLMRDQLGANPRHAGRVAQRVKRNGGGHLP